MQSLTQADVEVPLVADGIKTLHDGAWRIYVNTWGLPGLASVAIDGAVALGPVVVPAGFTGALVIPGSAVPAAGTRRLVFVLSADPTEPPANLVRASASASYGP